MDDSGLPQYLRLLYEDATSYPHPFHFSADLLKFAVPDDDDVKLIRFWELRRLLIERLGRNLDEELAFLEELFKYDSRDQLKWAHRRWIVEKFGPVAARKDLESTKKIIHRDFNSPPARSRRQFVGGDAYNPLAWSHRRWVFQRFGGDWEDELTFCGEIIEEDIFNSFAWNQRYFVVSKSPSLGGLKAMRDQEVSYALEAIDISAWNVCPWTYLRLLYMDDLRSLVMNRGVEDTCLSVFKREKDEHKIDRSNAFVVDDLIDGRGSVHALRMVLDLMSLGFQPSQELLDALRSLCQSDPGFVDKARLVLRDAKFEVYDALYRPRPVFVDEASLVLQDAKSDV